MAFTASAALLRALSSLTFVLGVAACGGATSSGLFDAPTGATTLDAGAGSPVNGGDAGSPGNTSPAQDSGAQDSASPAQQGDSAAPAQQDSGPAPVVDSGPPADPGITCGSDVCDPKNKVCCIGQDQSGGETYACESSGDCTSSGGLALPCQRAADCRVAGFPAGDVCCVTAGQDGLAATVACVPPTQCDQTSQSWLCDPSVTGSCPAGDTCSMSTVTIPHYSICVKSP